MVENRTDGGVGKEIPTVGGDTGREERLSCSLPDEVAYNLGNFQRVAILIFLNAIMVSNLLRKLSAHSAGHRDPTRSRRWNNVSVAEMRLAGILFLLQDSVCEQ